MRIDNMCNDITACCILHNICEIHQDEFDEEWLEEVAGPLSGGSSTTKQFRSCYCS